MRRVTDHVGLPCGITLGQTKVIPPPKDRTPSSSVMDNQLRQSILLFKETHKQELDKASSVSEVQAIVRKAVGEMEIKIPAWEPRVAQNAMGSVLWKLHLQGTTDTKLYALLSNTCFLKVDPSTLLKIFEVKERRWTPSELNTLKQGFSHFGRARGKEPTSPPEREEGTHRAYNQMNPLKATEFGQKYKDAMKVEWGTESTYKPPPVPTFAVLVAQQLFLVRSFLEMVWELPDSTPLSVLRDKTGPGSSGQSMLQLVQANAALAISGSRPSRVCETDLLEHGDLVHQVDKYTEMPVVGRVLCNLLAGADDTEAVNWDLLGVEESASKGKWAKGLPKVHVPHSRQPPKMSLVTPATAVCLLYLAEMAIDPPRCGSIDNPRMRLFTRREGHPTKDNDNVAPHVLVDTKARALTQWIVRHRPGLPKEGATWRIIKWFGLYGPRYGYAREVVAAGLLHTNMATDVRQQFGHVPDSQIIEKHYAANRTNLVLSRDGERDEQIVMACDTWGDSVVGGADIREHYKQLTQSMFGTSPPTADANGASGSGI